jgi:hypothetical protein
MSFWVEFKAIYIKGRILMTDRRRAMGKCHRIDVSQFFFRKPLDIYG